MPSQPKVLGIMKPLGGGDPVTLGKEELVVGRRASCDICLDYENVSGKHCILKYYNQTWHVRDLGSTNGTTVNGVALTSEHSVMPDDEVGIASHIFHIDYEPGIPTSVLVQGQIAGDDVAETRKRTSLLELAGLDTDDDRPKKRRPSKAPEAIERPSTDEADFEDALPDHVKADPIPAVEASDDDFLKLIEEDVLKKPGKK